MRGKRGLSCDDPSRHSGGCNVAARACFAYADRVLRQVRSLDAPELCVGRGRVAYRAIDMRGPLLRVGVQEGRGIASDYGLLDRATPFVREVRRVCLSIVLDGDGRFDEAGRRVWVRPGDAVLSQANRGGTEAYAGTRSRVLVLEWAANTIGPESRGGGVVVRLDERDRATLGAAAEALAGPRPVEAVVAIVGVLRSAGILLERLEVCDLAGTSDAQDRALAHALDGPLSNLAAFPAIDDVGDPLGWGQRLVHRRIAALASRYGLAFDTWRALLHHLRLAMALRLASAGATTELIAQKTGYRSPVALCHAFAKAGLPSPGTLAREARRDVLDAWTLHLRKPA